MLKKNKKQIVFIEPSATVNTYRIARSLKLTDKYQTTLICFCDLDKEFFGKAYDKILVLELSHKIRFKSLIGSFKNILSKKGREFFKKIKKIKPYIFQITGPDLFSLMTLFLLKNNKSPKIYYSNDMWGVEERSALFKRFGLKGEFQRICEKMCFKRVDGVLNKHSLKQFELLDYVVNAPKMAVLPYPLDDWIFHLKQKKGKEMHIAYGGNPFPTWNNNLVSFLEIIKIITSQKIHFHSYGPCADAKDNYLLKQESKKNKYYHFHEKVNPYILNREMTTYDYGILPDFREESEVEKNPGILKTENATRVTNYLEAGLPIITSSQNEYILSIINKNKIGFSINREDLQNLRKIIERKDYKQLQKNVKKFQEEFKLSKKIKEIEKFYEKIRKIKNPRT